MNVMVILIVIGAHGTVTKGLLQITRGHGKNWPFGDHPNDSIIKIGQNTEESSGFLKRVAVTQNPVNADELPSLKIQLMLM